MGYVVFVAPLLIALCLSVSTINGEPKTNSVSLNTTIPFIKVENVTNAPIAYFYQDPTTRTLYMSTFNTLIKIDLDSFASNPSEANTETFNFKNDNTNFNAPSGLISVNGTFYAAGTSNGDAIRIVDINSTSYGNPIVDVVEMGTFLASTKDDQYVYFAGSKGAIVMPISADLTVECVDSSCIRITETTATFSSAAFQKEDNTFYLGSKGFIMRYQIHPSNSTYTKLALNLTDSTAQISVLILDEERGFLYAASKDPNNGKLFKIDINTFTQERQITLAEGSIESGAIDPKGVLYLAGGKTARIAQIDLPEFRQEASLKLSGTLFAPQACFFDAPTQRLYCGTVTIGLKPVLIVLNAADACLNNCTNHGSCSYRYCTCDSFLSSQNNTLTYTQPWCAGMYCDYNCNSNGDCNYPTGTCSCSANWTGAYCEIMQCTNNCYASTGNGQCLYDANTTLPIECQCNEGWQGVDCHERTYKPCSEYKDCDSCGEAPGCGWCSSSKQCTEGNIVGPLNGAACRSWHFHECSTSYDIVNYILLALMIAMILFNIITFILDGTKSNKPPVRMEWYRFQRSTKAWMLVQQLQFIASLGLIGIKFPTIFLSFTRFWYWLMMAWGLPWRNDRPDINSGRQLLNVDQYEVYADITTNYLFVNVLFWSVIVYIGAMLGFFLVLGLAKIRGRQDIEFMAKTGPFYVSSRILDLIYYGMVVFTSAQIVHASSSSGGMVAGAVIMLVAIGVGFPVALTAGIHIRGKRLYKKTARARFFPTYGTIHLQKLVWSCVPIVKRLLIGLVIGLIRVSGTAQLILLEIIFVLYLVFIWFVDPFIDALQTKLEFILNILNIISVALVFAFLNTDLSSHGQSAITITFVILQVLAVFSCIAFYFIVWMQMYQIFTIQQLWKTITGRTPNNEEQMADMGLHSKNQ